MIKTTVYPLC